MPSVNKANAISGYGCLLKFLLYNIKNPENIKKKPDIQEHIMAYFVYG